MVEHSENWYARNRKRLGLSLVLIGLVPWVALMSYIVYIRNPSWEMMAVTLLCWAIAFAGKTMLKEKGHIRQRAGTH